MSMEVVRTIGHVRREGFTPKEEDVKGAWMSNEGKVATFLPWFTYDPVAEAPLKVIITLAKHKNLIRLVSKLFKSHAEEGTTKIKWIGPDNEEDKKLAKPNSLMPLLFNPERNGDGRLKDRLPNLKSIICCQLNTLMDLNGCPSGLEELKCDGCHLIQNLAPLAACTNLRKLDVCFTNVSSLQPLMGCVKLDWLDIGSTHVTDISPLSACVGLKVLRMSYTQVSDLGPLSGLHQLRLIDLDGTAVTDLSPLSCLLQLESLFCSASKISDLTPLSNCSELKALDINNTAVKSLTPLLQCKKLEHLNHSKLRDHTLEETRGYIRCLKEIMPQLHAQLQFLFWLESLPASLQHYWGRY
jgi:Leucine-rich repeat (LRR) protein